MSVSSVMQRSTFLAGQLRDGFAMGRDWGSGRRLAADLLRYRGMRYRPALASDRRRDLVLRDGTRLSYRQNRGEIWAVYEVWMRNCYRVPFPVGTKVLLDLGANIGLTSLWYARACGFERVIAVEPTPSNADLADHNLRANGVEADVVRAAVGPADGEARFRQYNVSTFNELVFDAAQPPRAEPGVRLTGESVVRVASPATLLEALPDGQRVDLVKLDIEGGEQALYEGDLSWLSRVDALVAELHPPRVDVAMIVARMKEQGFEYFSPEPGNEMHSFRRP